ncbi:hypothetical protein NCAS_0F01960 [Naumovozyma castellii]|uniref:Uncharacterized protein n=1 Tax=Naumovozyma castellii TaxID=27288 RepID=G0VGQ9_NAUCA|nr:hypothetical protein NCAS_0F01960 [Naumovozyma castellii CBS 4309]CCC70680.1 hypothetical protein NCAS_0F01960 [Naumovozyma castellii CBS 4309]
MTFPKKIPVTQWSTQLKTRLPKIITFDAYNTLYTTTLPVLQQYCIVAQKYGITANVQELSHKFPTTFKELNATYPNYGKKSGITPEQWWGCLIREIFKPNMTPVGMIDEILQRFEGFDAYVVYPDLIEFLKMVKAEHPEIILAVISNTDTIAYKLMQNVGLLKFFKNYVYLSYEVNAKKPNQEMFDYVLDDIVKRNPNLLNEGSIMDLKRSCWHVGDELHNDMIGAYDSGWNGVLLDRINKSGYLSMSFANIIKDEEALTRDKFETNSVVAWKMSMNQSDTTQVNDREYVVPNFIVLEKVLFKERKNETQ